MQILNLILAQSQGSGLSGIFMIIAMIAIFYFLMIRPQQKKQKEIKKQREAMAKGDRVVTAGGIHGRISADKGAYMIIEIAPGVNIRVDKASLFPAAEQSNNDTRTESKNRKNKVEKAEAAETEKDPETT